MARGEIFAHFLWSTPSVAPCFWITVSWAGCRQWCGLYYYKREDSTLEEDFFVRTVSELIPVEVKATNGRAKSLRTLIESEKYSDISHGIKLTGGNFRGERERGSVRFCGVWPGRQARL